jgi:hydroxypyruvate reductase
MRGAPRTGSDRPLDARTTLTELYWAGVRAVEPGPALRAALERRDARFARRVWLIALGKAAHPMAAAAVQVMASRGIEPAGGIILAPSPASSPHASIVSVMGDHPIPGAHSFAAAERLGEVVTRVRADDEVWVLLSGGATSLAAAPIAGLTPADLIALYTLLLGSGLDIRAMNAIRKRCSRWGAGRLVAALHPAPVSQFVISDVIGDDLAAIGSGPCVPDTSTAADVHAALADAGLWDRTPLGVREYLYSVERDPSLETPKPGNAAFDTVDTEIVAGNRIALDAIARRAAELEYTPRFVDAAVIGEAAALGARLGAYLRSYCDSARAALSGRTDRPCLIWGGEPTVTLPATGATGMGGRCQELALAAARALAEPSATTATAHPSDRAPSLLAAGTDGRDGATDAAGAIVDSGTWDAIRRAGRDPARDLAAHDSYVALDAVGAVLRSGLTGTNVMDVVIGICEYNQE